MKQNPKLGFGFFQLLANVICKNFQTFSPLLLSCEHLFWYTCPCDTSKR